MKSFINKPVKIEELQNGILCGDRIILAKAITIIESQRKEDQIRAEELIEKILPKTGNSIRIGITGVPGVGKSTFIETFGQYLTSLGKKIAVLTVDPSSRKTKGSILGDKTRMNDLSKNPMAFIRPSATGGALGGVTNATRDAILLCEASGFEIIVIETVGVGQSEVAVREMTDFFLLLMLPGAGDELQGIKKGIMEMADGIAITKSDGENIQRAKQAQADYQQALHLFGATYSGYKPKVLISSALMNTGVSDVWIMIEEFMAFTKVSGYFIEQRMKQDVLSIHNLIEETIRATVAEKSKDLIHSLEEKVKLKQLSPRRAAQMVLENFKLKK
jgi:LAO/AO transport system kinase